ncbi:MAG: hypothetical protein AB2551_02595 [Candidatus Thiodiazotropha sp.]
MASEQQISNLTSRDHDRLNEQRTVITKYLSKEDLESKYQTPTGKLGTLRALLAANVFQRSQTYELQSIKYKDTSIILYLLTMISKRVEKDEAVDVFELFNGTAARVEELIENGY